MSAGKIGKVSEIKGSQKFKKIESRKLLVLLKSTIGSKSIKYSKESSSFGIASV